MMEVFIEGVFWVEAIVILCMEKYFHVETGEGQTFFVHVTQGLFPFVDDAGEIYTRREWSDIPKVGDIVYFIPNYMVSGKYPSTKGWVHSDDLVCTYRERDGFLLDRQIEEESRKDTLRIAEQERTLEALRLREIAGELPKSDALATAVAQYRQRVLATPLGSDRPRMEASRKMRSEDDVSAPSIPETVWELVSGKISAGDVAKQNKTSRGRGGVNRKKKREAKLHAGVM